MIRFISATNIFCLAMLLSACGGGGGGGDSDGGSSGGGEQGVDNGSVMSLQAPNLENSILLPDNRLFLSWSDVQGATFYEVTRTLRGLSSEKVLTTDESEGTVPVSLHLTNESSFSIRACNTNGCSGDSAPSTIDDDVFASINYIKSENPVKNSLYGDSVVVSDDAQLLAVAAPEESTTETGVPVEGTGNEGDKSGAVYLYKAVDGRWEHFQTLRSPRFSTEGRFGKTLAFSGDGQRLAVGQPQRKTAVAQENKAFVLVFEFDGSRFQPKHEVSIPEAHAQKSMDAYADFGSALDLNSDGSILVVGAPEDATEEAGINPEITTTLNTSPVGIAFVFRLDGEAGYGLSDIIKPPFVSDDVSTFRFGSEILISGDGSEIYIAAALDPSLATGLDGDPSDAVTDANDGAPLIGASYQRGGVYSLKIENEALSYSTYFKPDAAFAALGFGSSISLSGNDQVLVIAAANQGKAYTYQRINGAWEEGAGIAEGANAAVSPDGRYVATVGESLVFENKDASFENTNDDCSQSTMIPCIPEHGVLRVHELNDGDATTIFEFNPRTDIPGFNADLDYDLGGSLSFSRKGQLIVGAPRDDASTSGTDAEHDVLKRQDSGAVLIF